MEIRKFEVGPLAENCYLLKIGNSALVIDPGFPDKSLFDFLEHQKLDLKFILLTHGHPDHCGGVEELKQRFGGKIVAHKNVLKTLKAMREEFKGLEVYFQKSNKGFSVDIPVLRNQTIKKEKINFQVFLTPGHSEDSLVFVFEKNIFSGDLIFKEGIGRYDLPGGDFEKLKKSLLKILSFPLDFKIYPGHGPSFLVEEARNFLGKIL